MTANRIHIQDIRNIGTFGLLTVKLPSFAALCTAKSLVSYVKKAYPRHDELTYFGRVKDEKGGAYTLTIGTIKPDVITRKMSLEEIKEVMV